MDARSIKTAQNHARSNKMAQNHARSVSAVSGADALTWTTLLYPEKQQPYFQKILQFLKTERALGKKIYPTPNNIFNALTFTPFANIKVVIIG